VPAAGCKTREGRRAKEERLAARSRYVHTTRPRSGQPSALGSAELCSVGSQL